jgi:hypothetical protein
MLGREVRQGARRCARNTKQISKERDGIARQPPIVLTEERFEALEPLFRGIIRSEPRLPLELRNKGKERAIEVTS